MGRAFSDSGPRLSSRDYLWTAAAVAAAAVIYLSTSALTFRLGFPLDDSWIHATYARNLAFHGQWAFQLGEPSAGSTAPLWTLLIVPGFLLGFGPLWWTYFLGYASLYGLSLMAEATTRRVLTTYHPRWPWVALFIAGEWHMQWAAASGMETILQCLLATGVLMLLITGSRRYLLMGLLTGLSVWVRPDGVTLAVPVLLTLVLVERARAARLRGTMYYLIGLGSLLLPYLLFNLWLSGTPMPNTFYAKQAEYTAWQVRPMVDRIGVVLLQLLTGPSVVLLPGFVAYAVVALRRRSAAVIAAMLWAIGYLALYTLRLPAYQHGRYLMPAMPLLFVLGLLGYLEFTASNFLGRFHWAFHKAWQATLILLTLGFVVLGARAYALDVGLIESEMVNTAKWAATNLPPDSVIAAHDIGALGYFDEHRLIDMAGLVSPEVIPIIRNEMRLADFLSAHHAGYLIAFPNVYPDLAAVSRAVHESGGRFAPAMGEPNMTVYCWLCQ